jgi:uncharacterized SAM-binding protein YcdF (DUF218 family)
LVRLLLLGLVSLVVMVCLVWWMPDRWLPGAAGWLDVGDGPHRVDAVFILPGDQQSRPFVAADLVNGGWADRALYPQNAPAPATIDAGRLPTEVVIRRVLEHEGLSAEQIVMLAGATRTTEEDLLVLGPYLQQHPEARVAIVTSHYHTRRTRLLIRRLLSLHSDRITYVSAPTLRFNLDDWWRHEAGFFAITSEYLKLAYCCLRYRSLPF